MVFEYDNGDAKGKVTIVPGIWGPNFEVTSPDGTKYTGFIDLFHFAPAADEVEHYFLQIVVDPIDSEDETFHARVWPDGRRDTLLE